MSQAQKMSARPFNNWGAQLVYPSSFYGVHLFPFHRGASRVPLLREGDTGRVYRERVLIPGAPKGLGVLSMIQNRWNNY